MKRFRAAIQSASKFQLDSSRNAEQYSIKIAAGDKHYTFWTDDYAQAEQVYDRKDVSKAEIEVGQSMSDRFFLSFDGNTTTVSAISDTEAVVDCFFASL